MNFDNLKPKLTTPSHTRETYIKKTYPDLYNFLLSDKFKDFNTFSDKVAHFLHGGGHCLNCNKRTKRETGKPGFRRFCSPECGNTTKVGKPAHNKSNIDEELVRKMYVNEKKSPKEIGIHFNVSHVTINKVITKLGIKRSHKEQQSIHSTNKGKPAHRSSGLKNYDFNLNTPFSARQVQSIYNVDLNLVYMYALKQDYKFKSKSYIEDIIKSILDQCGVDYQHNRKNIISPLELDFYIPSHNLAIECNGLYHHCSLNKDTNYHRNKYELCRDKGIQLLHFWEDDIRDKPHIIEDYIKSKLNLTNKIYARKCNIQEVSSNDAIDFYNNYHIQGRTKSGKHYGLYYNSILVACMSFSKNELIRFCSKGNTTVVGGFSKLLKHYIKNSCGDIVSFSNNDYSNGNVYYINGFIKISENKYNMMYTDLKYRYTREKYMKHKLKNIFDNFDINKTEKQILSENGIYQCYGSGTIKWIYRRS